MRLAYNLIFLFSLFCITTAYALPGDRSEKVNIVADAATYNYKTGVNIFEGNVKVDQGSTHITADKLITHAVNHQLHQATAYGTREPAHYWTTPEKNEPPIHAKAMVIKFFPIESNVILENNVQVSQGKNSFQGQLIHYNNRDQTIIVPPTQNGRAVIVYHPDK